MNFWGAMTGSNDVININKTKGARGGITSRKEEIRRRGMTGFTCGVVLAKSLSKDLAQRRPCTGTHNITESGGGKHHHTSHCCHIWLNSQNLLLTIKVDGSVMDSINAGGEEVWCRKMTMA